jgi:hypothetical protein
MKPRYILPSIFMILNIGISLAQAPAWKWAKSAIGNEYDQANTAVCDSHGNVYVAGYFASDSIIFGNTTLKNNGPGFDDLFIAKYDSTGRILWVQSAGGSMDDKASSVAIDATGNVYLTGYFYSPDITFGSFTLTNSGVVGDILIVKYDESGNVLWAKREGAPGLEIPFSIVVDDTGNIVVAGRFSSQTITFDTITLHQQGSMDVFIVKYNETGNVLWAKGAGGGSNDEAYAIDFDADGNIYMAGYFNQHATFGDFMLTTEGSSDMFLVKYDNSGSIVWAERAGGKGDDRATAISVDGSGNSYVAGFFTNDTITFGSATLVNASGDNSFIAKYDPEGRVLWAKGLNGDSKALGITETHGKVYVCGRFSGDTLSYGSYKLLLDGSSDLYLVNCDADGNAKWMIKQTSGGGSSESANAIAADQWGNIFIAGDFGSHESITFGSSVLIPSDNSYDMFIARLGNNVTGIEYLQDPDESIIYPNPSKGSFAFHFYAKSNGIYRIRLIDIQGRETQIIPDAQMVTGKNDIYVNTENMSKGFYFVQIELNDRILSREKLVIQ